jgi:hypothetical protein
VEFQCEQCHRTFTAQRSTARYCSGECRTFAYRLRAGRRLWFTPAQRERIPKGKRPCGNPDCDKEIHPLDRPDMKFCSAACRQKAYRARLASVTRSRNNDADRL